MHVVHWSTKIRPYITTTVCASRQILFVSWLFIAYRHFHIDRSWQPLITANDQQWSTLSLHTKRWVFLIPMWLKFLFSEIHKFIIVNSKCRRAERIERGAHYSPSNNSRHLTGCFCTIGSSRNPTISVVSIFEYALDMPFHWTTITGRLCCKIQIKRRTL